MSFDTLRNEVSRLEPMWNSVLHTFGPFLLSGVVALWFSSALIYLSTCGGESGVPWRRKHPRAYNSILLLHATPLVFGVPVTTGMLLRGLDSVGLYRLKFLQKDVVLASIGTILFTFVAYALLSDVLRLPNRLSRAVRLIGNMQNEPITRRAAVLLHAVLPPLALTLGVLLVLQNSMYAAPVFISRQNAMRYLLQAITHMVAPIGYRAFIAFSIALTITVFLVTVYFAADKAALLALWVTSRARRPRSTIPAIWDRRFVAVARFSLTTTAILSSLIFAVVAGTVVVNIFAALLDGIAKGQSTNPSSAVRSLVTPGTISAGVVGFIVWIGAMYFRRHRIALWERNWTFGAVAAVAFTPPTLYGSLALPLVTQATEPFIVWATTCSWAAGIVLLVGYTEVFESRYTPLVNSRLVSLSARRFATITSLSRLGSFLPKIVFVAYLLWVEEGLQVTLNVDGTLATLLYRGHSGEWSTAALAGLICCLVLWLCAFSASSQLQPVARRWVERSYRAKLLTAGVLFSIVLPLSSLKGQVVRQDSLIIDAQTFKVTLPAASPDLHVGSLVVRNSSAIDVTVPAGVRRVEIDTVVIATSQPPQISIRGSGDTLDYLKVRSVRFRGETYTALGIRFEKFMAGSVEFSNPGPGVGSSETDYSNRLQIEFDNESSAEQVVLRSLRLTSASITVRTPRGSQTQVGRVELIGIQASRIRIKGADTENPRVALTIESSLWQPPDGGLPSMELRDFTWAGGTTKLQPAGRVRQAIVDLTRVNYSSSENSDVDVQQFPQAVFRWANSVINGSIVVKADTLQEITLNELRRGPGLEEAQIKVNGKNFNTVGLADLDLSALDLFSEEGSEWYFTSLQGVDIQHRITVPQSFLASAVREWAGSAQTRRFMTTLQDYGVYAEDSRPVGFDAVYERNIAEMSAILPPVAMVLDWFTGLGIRLWKPLLTWLIYTAFYVLIASVLIYKSGGHTIPAAIGIALLYLFTTDHAPAVSAQYQRRLAITVNTYRFIAFLQTTLVTLYLGQTALGL